MLKKLSFIISCLLLVSARGFAVDALSATAAADKQTVTIGDPVRFTVTLNHPSNYHIIEPQKTDTLGAWDIKGSSVTRQDSPSSSTSQIIYTLAAFTTGQVPIPAVTVRYTDGTGKTGTAATLPVPVTIESVLAKAGQANDIRDIKPPITMPLPWWVYLAWIAGIGVAGYGLYFWYTNYYQKKNGILPEPDVPPVPPYQAALEALEQLKNSELVREGKIKEFYIALSDIIRDYLSAVYEIETRDKTTAEIYTRLRAAESDKKKLIPIKDFFEECDLVKFAKFRPEETVCWQDWDAAKKIVEI